MALLFKRGREAVKNALDRRYAQRDYVERQQRMLSAISRDLEELSAKSAAQDQRLRDVKRLVEECADSLERASQAEMVLLREIDELPRSHDSPRAPEVERLGRQAPE